MTLDCDAVERELRRMEIDHLEAEARRREDMFLVDLNDPYRGVTAPSHELNTHAIAEWAYDLLQKQKELVLDAVEKALECRDNDTKEKA